MALTLLPVTTVTIQLGDQALRAPRQCRLNASGIRRSPELTSDASGCSTRPPSDLLDTTSLGVSMTKQCRKRDAVNRRCGRFRPPNGSGCVSQAVRDLGGGRLTRIWPSGL